MLDHLASGVDTCRLQYVYNHNFVLTVDEFYSNTLDLLARGVGHADCSTSMMTSMSLSYVCYSSTLDQLASGVGPCRLQYEYDDLYVLILCMLFQHVRPVS